MVHQRQFGQLHQLQLHREPILLPERGQRADRSARPRCQQEFAGCPEHARLQTITTIHLILQGTKVHHREVRTPLPPHPSPDTNKTHSLQKSGLKYSDIIIEIPIHLHNAHNVTTFLNQVPRPLTTSTTTLASPSSLHSITTNPTITSDTLAPTYDKLTLSIDPFLQQTCDNLLDSIETHHIESNNFSYYSRALAREQTKIAQWQAKRKAENAARAISKQTPLPEDEWQKLFKLPTEPSRLENMLNSRQVEQYARQVDGFVAGTSGKMFAVRGNLIPGESGMAAE